MIRYSIHKGKGRVIKNNDSFKTEDEESVDISTTGKEPMFIKIESPTFMMPSMADSGFEMDKHYNEKSDDGSIPRIGNLDTEVRLSTIMRGGHEGDMLLHIEETEQTMELHSECSSSSPTSSEMSSVSSHSMYSRISAFS